MDCPSDDTLARFVGRELDEPRRSAVEAHVDGCAACQQCISMVVDVFAASAQTSPATQTETILASGSHVGRYVVLDVVGHGAMGVVYAAYDPELDRKVAVKLVRAPPRGTDPGRWRSRLVTEGRALAAVSHPNVLPIHDVGNVGDAVFIAMELVDGGTLTQWMQRASRTTTEIIDVFAAAGRGLAAAHGNDLVHRDFKPDNVLIGTDGRVRVSDFGLARFAAGPSTGSPDPGTPDPGSAPDPDPAARTHPGTILGTPVYMAPEVLAGGNADPRSDQFSFCVALYEALYGVRPFSGASLSELADSTRRPPATKGNGRRVPARVREVVLTGLAHDPDERHASVAALVEALTRRPFAGWTGSRVLLVGLIGGVGATVALNSASRPCGNAAEQLGEAWDAARRDQVRDAVLGPDAPYAAVTWTQLSASLDRYAAEWIAMHTETCTATVIDKVQSSEAMDLRMGCLRRARVGLAAATELLGEGDTEVVVRAQSIVASLPLVSRCSDGAALKAEIEPPRPSEAATVERIEALLARVRSAVAAGRFLAATEQIADANALLVGLEYAPIRTDVALAEGRMHSRAAEHETAQTKLRDALRMASEHRQWAVMRDAAMALMYVVGVQLDKPAEALRYREVAEGLGRQTPDAEAEFQTSLGAVLNAGGHYAEAEAAHRKSVTLFEKVHGSHHVSTVKARANLGIVLRAQGKLDEAEGEHRRALNTSETLHGREHPETARILSNLANVIHALGRYEEAEAAHREVLATRTEVYGEEHVLVAEARGNLANALAAQDKFAEAEAEHRRSLSALRTTLGPEHPNLARAHNNLGAALFSLGRLGEAAEEIQRARVLFEQSLGADHPTVLSLRNNRALLLAEQGDSEQAVAELRELLALQVRRVGPGHLDVAESRAALCTALHKVGRFAEAEAQANQALPVIVAALGEGNPKVAHLQANLGRALYRQGKLIEAARAHRQSIGVLEQTLAPGHTDLAVERSNLAEVLVAQGQAQRSPPQTLLREAVTLAEKAYGAHAKGNATPAVRARAAFILARALSAGPPSKAALRRARALAREALRIYIEAGEPRNAEADVVRTWLSQHGG